MQKRPVQHAGGGHKPQRVQPRFWLVSLGTIAVIFGFVFHRGAQGIQKQQQENAARIVQMQTISAEIDALKRRLAFTQTDRYAEQEARRRFGYIKEGELRYMLDGSGTTGIVAAWNAQPQVGAAGETDP